MSDITISHGQLEAWAGRRLSDEDIERLEGILHLSTLPEVIGDVFAGMALDEYWPEEGQPEFVRRFGENFWTPLCRCGEPLRMPEGNVQVWECSFAPVSHPRVMLWAEDWPDYEDEEESDLAIITETEKEDP